MSCDSRNLLNRERNSCGQHLEEVPITKYGSSLFCVGRFVITIIETGIFRLIREFKYSINIHELSTKSSTGLNFGRYNIS